MQENTAKTKKDKTTLLMTDGNIWKLLIVFSIPLILGNLLQQMYNTADSIIVGNFVGSNGLAAVGAGTALINLIIAFAQGAAVGAGAHLVDVPAELHTDHYVRVLHTGAVREALSGA